MGNMIVQQQHAVSDIERMARAFAQSKLFGVTNPEQAVALCLIAQAEGRHPASAAQDYHIIQGKPAKKADAMLRDFLANGGKVEWHTLDDTTADATFSHPAGGSVRITWDMERARMAGLATPMWKKYPRQMLRSRTVSEGVRTVFPMATSGMYVPEEVQDFDTSSHAVSAPAVEREAPMIEHQPEPSYGRHYAAIESATDLAQLQTAWETAKSDKGSMTLEEQAWLTRFKNERKETLTPPPSNDDPFGFDQIEREHIPYGNDQRHPAEYLRS